MAEISILVPVYNGEKYLNQCLDSILAQDFCDFELIVINDGSTDGTLAVLEQYAARDDRIRVISQENKGISASRNCAIREAAAQWLVFVDADDWVDRDYLSYLRQLRDKTKMPVVACNHWIEAENSRTVRAESSEEITVLSLQEAQLAIAYNGIPDISPWGKMYRQDILRGICYPEGKVFEDTARIAEILKASGGIAFGAHPAYHYRYSNDSISKKVHISHVWDYMDAVDHMLGQFEVTTQLMERGRVRRQTHAALSTMRLQVFGGEPDWERALKIVRKNAVPVLRDPKASVRDKIGALAALPGKKCFDLIWGIYAHSRRKY